MNSPHNQPGRANNHTSVAFTGLRKAANRLDAGFHLAASRHESVTADMSRRYTREQALAKVSEIPARLLDILEPLLTTSAAARPNETVLRQAAQKYPYLALAMIATALPDRQGQAQREVEQAQDYMSVLQSLSRSLPGQPAQAAASRKPASAGR